MANRFPHIYEINTWTWLHALNQQYDESITLGNIPTQEIEKIISYSADFVWLMGIWTRSPRGIEIAREHPGLQGEYMQSLQDFSPDDVVGSPYAIADYKVDPQLGDREGLLTLRRQLAEYNIGLLLDFVPNHLATDHPWTREHPDYFIKGSQQELNQRRQDFFAVDEAVFAHGKDPYFPAWTDTVQMNAFNLDLRQAIADLLIDIGTLCDGVRCDMAMLMTNSIFQQTWGDRGGKKPQTEYWLDIIPQVKAEHEDFLFIAEVYWHMEMELQRQGFDFCYDKSLYDGLENGHAQDVLNILRQPKDFQAKLVRFIENHDEPRAVSSMGFNRAWLSAMIIATLPGMKLWHEGQFVGHQVKLPVQLGRRPEERDDTYLEYFYQLLLKETHHPVYQHGEWELIDIHPAWQDNQTYANLIAYMWHYENHHRLMVINFSNDPAQGTLHLHGIEGKYWILRDIINNRSFERHGDDMVNNGLYVDLTAWSGHLFQFWE